MEKRKENYFGSAEISKKGSSIDVLTIYDYFGCGSAIVWDSEIKDNEDSPEAALIKVADENGGDISLFIHKKDCLQLANFLLNIHTEYANRMNRIEQDEFRQKL